MLEYEISLPTANSENPPLIVLLHGRGSDKHDLMSLRPVLPAEAILVTPRAPFASAQWGYGDGYAWYQFIGGTTPEAETFVAGQAELATFFTELPATLPVKPGPVIIGGFSQGATSALAFALRHPGAVRGVLMFSGFLASHGTVETGLSTATGLPVFWGHGTQDPMIPHAHAVAGRQTLVEAGVNLTAKDYPIGHSIDNQELIDARAWLDGVLK